MKLSLQPREVPFMVGDTVWVNQSDGKANQQPDYQAKIIQIILDGKLTNSLVVRQREDNHVLTITTAIYDLKPTGDDDGMKRQTIEVSLESDQTNLFETKEGMLDYQSRKD